jgi:hypothetical protein
MKIEIATNQTFIINRIAQLMILRKVGRRLRSLRRTLCVAGAIFGVRNTVRFTNE